MERAPIDLSLTTPALRRLLGRAVLITRRSGEGQQGLQASFTTTLLAFLVSDDPLSQWFQAYTRAQSINTEAIASYKKIDHKWLEEVRSESDPESELGQLSNVTSSAQNLFSEALEIRNSRSGSGPLDVRHLLGAYIYRPGSVHESEMMSWGFEREALSNAFLSQLNALYSNLDSEFDAWRELHTAVFGSPPQLEAAGTTVPRALLATYSPDAASGRPEDDLLDIRPEVNGLAALIASTHTVPPLAIGIFGDWGSGKTFFMRSLMSRVDELTKTARSDDAPNKAKLQKEISFFKRVVQIEFNAWHYVEGNLWASLVEHIFANLRISQDPKWDPDGTKMETLQKDLFEQLEVQRQLRAEVDRAATTAERRLRQVRRQRRQLQAKRNRKLAELDDLRFRNVIGKDDLAQLVPIINSALTQAGYPPLKEQGAGVEKQVEEVRAALAASRATMQYAGAVFTPLWRAQDRSKRLRLLLGALVAGPLLGLALGAVTWLLFSEAGAALQQTASRMSASASGLIATVGLLANWLRRQAEWVSTRLETLEKANVRLNELQESKLAEHDARLEQMKQQAASLDADLQRAQQREQTAQERIEEIREELQQVIPVNMLARFIEDRTESEDYRKHLGILALIRRDFQTLSSYIADENSRLLHEFEELTEEQEGAGKRINRIVLYIDDLDRCPSHKVVKVLEAVHLLLAFPLFVVVVGVDARWVSQSLERKYPHLRPPRGQTTSDSSLGFGRKATPHDYLEKIFQVPIWLNPVGETGSKNMLQGLLAGSLVQEERPPDEERVTPDADGADGRATGLHPLPGHPDAARQVAAQPQQPAIDLAPQSLQIEQKELDFMKDLAPITGRSPRAIKRFVNVYRLVKVTLEEKGAGLTLADDDGVSDYQAVLFLLAVITGAPPISRQFFRLVMEGAEQNRQTREALATSTDQAIPEALRDLQWVLAELSGHLSPEAATEHLRLNNWLEAYDDGSWKTAALEPFARRALQVARYSFRVEQLSSGY